MGQTITERNAFTIQNSGNLANFFLDIKEKACFRPTMKFAALIFAIIFGAAVLAKPSRRAPKPDGPVSRLTFRDALKRMKWDETAKAAKKFRQGAVCRIHNEMCGGYGGIDDCCPHLSLDCTNYRCKPSRRHNPGPGGVIMAPVYQG